MNFRLHAKAVTADIQKMYRSIWLNPEQRFLQHILWRSDPASDVQEYELAYLAQRVLLQLVEDEGHELATQALVRSHQRAKHGLQNGQIGKTSTHMKP